METRYTEKLSKTVLIGIYAAIAFFALRYFGNIIGYIVLSLIIALIAKPLVTLFQKVKIRGRRLPDSILALMAIVLIICIISSIVAGLVPVFTEVIKNISALASGNGLDDLSIYLANLNASLIDIFRLDPDFKIEVAMMNKLTSIFSFDMFGNMVGTVAHTIGGIGVGLFSVVFISFFLIKDNTLFERLITGITPDKHRDNVTSTISEVERLLSRYFIGLIIDMVTIGTIIFLGLWGIARVDISTALSIGFMAGCMNIIPYVGPLIGCVFGTLMATVMKFCYTGFFTGISIGMFILLVVVVFMLAHLIDNILFQPLIYSTSVQAHPLEIFIVLLIAGSIGGIVGMLLGIPAYTVIRVLCIKFRPDARIVRTFYTKK